MWKLTVVLGAWAMLGLGGCSANECADCYEPCHLDPSSPNEAVAECGADDDPMKTCVVRDQIQCDTRICGRLDGGDAICTSECAQDSDCAKDETCREWGLLGKFCAPE